MSVRLQTEDHKHITTISQGSCGETGALKCGCVHANMCLWRGRGVAEPGRRRALPVKIQHTHTHAHTKALLACVLIESKQYVSDHDQQHLAWCNGEESSSTERKEGRIVFMFFREVFLPLLDLKRGSFSSVCINKTLLCLFHKGVTACPCTLDFFKCFFKTF